MTTQRSEVRSQSAKWSALLFRTPNSELRTFRRSGNRSRSAGLLEEAQRVLVGGVNSPVRTFRAVKGASLVLAGGKGARVRDADGHKFTDCIMGWGALILGHAHPRVMQAVRRQLARGAVLGLTHEAEIRLAGLITEAMPSIEQIRFTASGTEACMTAIRLARAHTGRSKVLMFEGCYHGHSDGFLVKRRGSGLATLGLAGSAGVPDEIAHEALVVPYNDLEALDHVFETFGRQLACVILEPIAANMGVVKASDDALHHLLALARWHKALVIFDEVVSGFRVAYGGAQALLDAKPDLTVLGKIIGGGFPIGAVGGPRRLMRQLAPSGPVYHAGTFAGHPITMTAGIATLETLRREHPYRQLDVLGARLEAGWREAARRAGVPAQINRVGSMLTLFVAQHPVTNFSEIQQTDTAQFAAFANGLRRQGILIPPSPFEAMFLSTAHTPRIVDHLIRSASHAFA